MIIVLHIHMNLFDHPKYLSDELNASSEEEIFYAFKQGVKEIYGRDLPFDSLAILMAHSALETGKWRVGLHRWNFGNVRAYPSKLKDDEFFTMFKCGEILRGKEVFFEPPHPNSAFRAFRSREEGIKHHLKFLMRKRYKKAWEMILVGNAEGYSHELRAGGYYTANKKLYTRALVKLTSEYLKKKDKLTSWRPVEPEANAYDVETGLVPIPSVEINRPDKIDYPNTNKAATGSAIVAILVAAAAYIMSQCSNCLQ